MASTETTDWSPPGAFVNHRDDTTGAQISTRNHHRNPSFQWIHGSSSQGKKRKASVVERLKKLGKDINMIGNKGSKVPEGGSEATTSLAWGEAGPSMIATESLIKDSEVMLDFEEEMDPLISRSNSSAASPTLVETGSATLPPVPPAELLQTTIHSPTDAKNQETEQSLPTIAEEPASLAQKIRGLIDSLPVINITPSRLTPVSVASSNTNSTDHRPTLPPDATPIKDSRLIAILSSATIMNGPSGMRTSVWGFLESLGAPKHQAPPEGYGCAERERDPMLGSEHDINDDAMSIVFSDTSSVMVYSPLQPTREDLVELAELVPLEPESDDQGAQDTQAPEQKAGWGRMWPFSFSAWYSQVEDKGKRKEVEEVPEPQTGPVPESEVLRLSTDSATGENVRRRARLVQQAWVPSRTKLSVQAMWWGYRLYLPPPVMDVLSDKQLEATKRTAMITTALTWFFSNLPIGSLPAAVRPALLLLQQLAPFLGYIGAFISWSWSTIKSYDLGYGVILTATWLLPVALIPGTWFEADFPKSPSLSSPIPLPAASLPAGPSNPAMPQGYTPKESTPIRSYSSPLATPPLYLNSPSSSQSSNTSTSNAVSSSAMPIPPASSITPRPVVPGSPSYPQAMLPTPTSPRSPHQDLPPLPSSEAIASVTNITSSPRVITLPPGSPPTLVPPSSVQLSSPHTSYPLQSSLANPTSPRSPRISRLPSSPSSSGTPSDIYITPLSAPLSPSSSSSVLPSSTTRNISSPDIHLNNLSQSPRFYSLPPSPYPSPPSYMSYRPSLIPPIPPPMPAPLPIPPTVAPNSPQGYMLLQSPLVQTIPLPHEEYAEVTLDNKRRKSKGKSRARAPFSRGSKSG